MKSRTKLWLDDIRKPPDGSWTWATSAAGAIELLRTGEVTEASLDHDLGMDSYLTGYSVVCWMETNNVWPENGVWVHSLNPVGAQRMRAVIAAHYGARKA